MEISEIGLSQLTADLVFTCFVNFGSGEYIYLSHRIITTNSTILLTFVWTDIQIFICCVDNLGKAMILTKPLEFQTQIIKSRDNLHV